MPRIATLELHKEALDFSAGHFTIFSATEREDLHGHNYSVSVAFEIEITDNGMSFDYRIYKNILQKLCGKLDRKFLLPAQSQFLTLEETEEFLLAHFNREKIPFLKRDVVVLPICNVTIEELSNWFLQELIEDREALKKHRVRSVMVKVFNGPEQSGGAQWKCAD